MKIQTLITLTITHVFVGFMGFAIGIYALPILIAPPSPNEADIAEMSSQATYSAEFSKDLEGSDALHWGEGNVSVGDKHISLKGSLAPGPDYKLYLSSTFVETEEDFERLKHSMVFVGDVNTFKNFVVEVDENIEISQFNTVVVWCETFGEFITSAKYR